MNAATAAAGAAGTAATAAGVYNIVKNQDGSSSVNIEGKDYPVENIEGDNIVLMDN